MTDHLDTTFTDSLDVGTNAVPLQENPWTVTTAPNSGSVRVELPIKGIDFEIDCDLGFQLLDALHSPAVAHSSASPRPLPVSENDHPVDRKEREL